MTDVHDLLRRALGGVAPSPDALQATIQVTSGMVV
jgi:hypothetical protein